MELKSGYYRLSIKALIFNEDRSKFLLVQEDNGKWELPGGGLDWGESPQVGIVREVKEEMGLVVTEVAATPAYLTTGQRDSDSVWVANALFETKVENLDFTASSECVALGFFTKEEALQLDVFFNVREFLKIYTPEKHS